jgi:ATP-binding cassette subfamily F protein uup
VTSTLVFEGAGRLKEYVGGYEDWLRQRPDPKRASATAAGGTRALTDEAGDRERRGSAEPAVARKLAFREQKELEQLPATIEALELEQQALAAKVAGPDFYREGAAAIKQSLERVETVHQELLRVLARWDELDSRKR